MKYLLPILVLFVLRPSLSLSQGRGGEPVVFGGRNAAVTRSIATRFSAGDKLGVLAYELDGMGEWNAAARPGFMYNTALESTPLGFTYSPQKYYPANGDKVRFFAYYPYNAPGLTLSSATTADYPTLTFTCPDAADVDLLAAVTEPQNTGSVYFRCDHLLARINISVNAAREYDSEPDVVVDRVVIQLPRRGTFRFSEYVQNPASPASWWTVESEVLTLDRASEHTVANELDGMFTALFSQPLLIVPGGVKITVHIQKTPSDALQEYTVDPSVLHAGKSANFQITLKYVSREALP